MNYSAMNDHEVLHYLDIYSDDPLIRRLVNSLTRTRGALVDDLVDAGMDAQHWTFGDGWDKSSPGQYIQELQHRLDQAESDLRLAQRELEDMQDECDRLRARTIMDFIEEVHEEKRAAKRRVDEAYREVNLVREQNDKLREQIDMWGRLNHV